MPGPHDPLAPSSSLGAPILLNRSVFSFTGVVIGAGCGLAWKGPEAISRRAMGNNVSTVHHSNTLLAMSQMVTTSRADCLAATAEVPRFLP